MVKHTNCLSVFDHFVGLALKGLNVYKELCFYMPPLFSIFGETLETSDFLGAEDQLSAVLLIFASDLWVGSYKFLKYYLYHYFQATAT